MFVRYSSGRAAEIQEINHFLAIQQFEPTEPSHNRNLIDNATISNVNIVANCTTFSYLQCIWRVTEIHENYLMCKVLQTRNSNYICSQTYRINDINAVKQQILFMIQTE